MTLAQGLTAIIIFWAVVGGIGACAPAALDAVAHPWQLRGSGADAYALVGAAAAIAAAVGPLLGGFITTYLSWRIEFLLEIVIIGIVLSGIRLVQDAVHRTSRRRRG